MRIRPSIVLLSALGLAAAGFAWQAGGQAQETKGPPRPRSVILLIGDGMGPQQLGLLFDWSDAAGKGETALQRLGNESTIGLLRTGSTDSPVTDSAAAATALGCGVTTANGFISVDPKGQTVKTCLEDARDSGMRTGLVTTTRITHATPACFAAHVPNRGFEIEIGRQMFAANGPDVMFGGGTALLERVPEGGSQSLSAQAASAGYAVVTDWDKAKDLHPESGRMLGLFAPSHLPFLIDRDAEGERKGPTLTEMTGKALDLLGGAEHGFFLMVEGGRIDHGGHANDVAAVLGEMREFDDTVALVRSFIAEHPETLLVVTADHETGGLCLTYGMHATTYAMVASIGDAKGAVGTQTDDPRVHVTTGESFGVGREGFYTDRRSWDASASALARSAKWNVSFGSSGHSNTPVTVMAAGPSAERFAGVHQNTLVGTVLREMLKR